MDVSPEPSSPDAPIRINLVVFLLAIVGGSVDAIVMLGFHVLTAAQTGNTILLAVAFMQGQFTTGFHAAVSLIGYIVGVVVAEWSFDSEQISLFRFTPVGRTFLAELACLLSLQLCWQMAGHNLFEGLSAVLIVLAAISMGIQSTVVLNIHAGPRTTYVTGTLTRFLTVIIRRFFLADTVWSLAKTVQKANRPRSQSGRHVWRYGITWLFYLVGAFAGGLIFLHNGSDALALPIVAICIAIGIVAWRTS